MVTGHLGDDFHWLREQVFPGMGADQPRRLLVMPFAGGIGAEADVMQESCRAEEKAVFGVQTVQGRQLVKERQSQLANVVNVPRFWFELPA